MNDRENATPRVNNKGTSKKELEEAMGRMKELHRQQLQQLHAKIAHLEQRLAVLDASQLQVALQEFGRLADSAWTMWRSSQCTASALHYSIYDTSEGFLFRPIKDTVQQSVCIYV